MRFKIPYKSLVLSLVAILSASADVSSQTYSGQATAVKVTVTALGQPVVTTAVADTGDLSTTGGTISLSSIGTSVAGIVSVGASTASTSGIGNSSQSNAGVLSTNIAVAGNTIAIGAVTSQTLGTCPGEFMTSSSSVASLSINGSSVTILGSAQSVPLSAAGNPIGTLHLNELISDSRSLTRNAVRLSVTDPDNGDIIEVVLASSRSGINCGFAPTQNLFSGRGTSVRLRQAALLSTDLSTIVSDTGPLPATGGLLASSTLGVSVGNLLLDPLTLGTGTATSSSSGGVAAGTPGSTQSTSSVEDLSLVLLPNPLPLVADAVSITAGVLSSGTQCTCSLTVPTCSVTDNTITDLQVVVLGVPVDLDITGLPNQEIDIPVLGLGNITLIVNGRTSSGPNDITAFPLRVVTNLTGLVATEVTIARSHSGIQCGLSPSAAPATVSGRVLDKNGRAISRAPVSITDGDGFALTTATNSSGRYTFKSVPTGKMYFVSADVKGGKYEPHAVTVDEDLSDLNLYPSTKVPKNDRD